MGKRIASNVAHGQQQQQQELTPVTARSIRKRKRQAIVNATTDTVNESKCRRLDKSVSVNNYAWYENDDEQSSSSSSSSSTSTNDAVPLKPSNNIAAADTIPAAAAAASTLLNVTLNASFCSSAAADLNCSGVTESPKPVYTLRPSVVNGTILHDLTNKPWRLGRPIGKGNFGEIFLASDIINIPVTHENAKYVVKIEPHANGPLFVEIHCLMNTAKTNSNDDNNTAEDGSEKPAAAAAATQQLSDVAPSGIPDYIASGSHYFGDARYRFLVLPRFDRDLHSLIKNSRVHQKSVLTLAIHIVNVLEKLHDRGYCHNDVKAQNLMISKCKYLMKGVEEKVASNGKKTTQKYDEQYEEKQQTTDSGNSSEQEANDDDYDVDHGKFVLKRGLSDDEEDEDFDDGATSNSNNSNSTTDIYQTPITNNRQGRQRGRNQLIEFSGSNPVRSCRRDKRHSIYEEMVKSHYLRPTKRVSYLEFFNDDGVPEPLQTPNEESATSDDEFVVARRSARRSTSKKSRTPCKSVNKRQQQLQQQQNGASSKKNSLAVSKRNRGGNVVISNDVPLQHEMVTVEEERIFLIDFGLASKYQDNGIHRPFIMDQRRAHDGTLEFTSRDAHLGAHSRRSDLECLGYNLLYWSQGYLPWKDAAMQQMQEKVHRSKELLMTDVREMLKQIYGKQVPKYLGEFLHHVGQLAYQERPDYERYRNLFKREYRLLGYDANNIKLSSSEIIRTAVRVKDEVDVVGKYDIFELNNKQPNGILRNLNLHTPYQEHSFQNRVSPKNLRSKSTKKTNKKKKFSWAEVLSQDPDQIARERAVKEFEREEDTNPLQSRKARHYEGKPTYAILQLLQHLKTKGRTLREHNDDLDQIMTADKENEGEVKETDGEDSEDADEYEEEVDEEEEEEEEEESDEVEEEEDSEEEEPSDDEDSDEDEEDYDTDSTTESSVKNSRSKKRTHKTQKTTSKRATTTNTATATIRSRSKAAANVKLSTKTRSCKNTKTESPLNVKNMKRNCKPNRTAAASAASEIAQHTTQRQKLQNGGGVAASSDGVAEGMIKLRERRARRCLQTTESEMQTVLDDESNSNYGPDMQSLNNIWKKFDNESIYAKGRTIAVSRHYRK